MKNKMYTITEIANLGYRKFRINLEDTGAFKKQISKVIKENDVKPVGKKKSTPTAKNDAAAFSQEVVDKIINDWLFEYLRRQSNAEVVQNYKSESEYNKMAREYNKVYQEESEESILNEFKKYERLEKGVLTYDEDSEEVKSLKTKMQSEALFTYFFPNDIENTTSLEELSSLSIILDSFFVREKIFSKLFTLDIRGLVSDINDCIYKQTTFQGKYSGDDMKLFHKLENWENYIFPITN